MDLLEKDWDEKNRVVRKTYVGTNTVSRLNNLIQKKKAEAMDIIFKLHESKQLPLLSITALRERIQQNGKTQSFFKYAEGLVAELKKANRIGTATSYRGLINVLKTFTKEKAISFTEINYSFLSRFETDHKSRGNGANGLAVYMRTIRAIFNRAIKEGIAEKETYPFADYKIKVVPTAKRALDWKFINAIISKKLPAKHKCTNARNYFVASYMMYGMNFADMAFLKKSDIVNGRINYRRQKTSKLYDIKISDSLNRILQHYIDLNPESEYVFPILKRENAEDQAKDIKWARKRYNSRLKDLAELCEIQTNLTSYVSRHSFATQAMLLEVPVKAISTMLGHSSLKTTETYLQSLPSNLMDDYNERIINARNKAKKPGKK